MGTSCLLTARVSGCNRDPEPPARMMPFSTVTESNRQKRNHEDTKTRRRKNDSLLRDFVSSWPKASGSPLSFPQTEPAAIVATRLHLLAPVAMLEVPAHGLSQAALERVARRPSELAANLRRVDRVPAIVAGTIGHERLQPAAAFSLGLQLVDDIADAIDDVEVRSFVAAADIILF